MQVQASFAQRLAVVRGVDDEHLLLAAGGGEGGRDVGRAIASINAEEGSRIAYVSAWVVPDARGRGIGRWLTVEALRIAAAAGASLTYLQVEPDNAPAQHLYRGLGLAPHHDYVYLALR